MTEIIAAVRRLGSLVALGAAVGTVVLGVGGRIVMRLIAIFTTGPNELTAGGTFTVVGFGTLSGAAGALLYAAGHALAARTATSARGWLGHLLFGVLLALVTMRGLRGTPPAPSLLFLPLVAAYGAILTHVAARRDSMQVSSLRVIAAKDTSTV